LHNNPLTVDYQFEPGSSADGASIKVPAPLLSQLTQRDLDWAIPGQLRERCIQLLKSLPKAQRKQLIPIPQFVDQVLADVDPGQQETDLVSLLLEQVRIRKGLAIDREQLASAEIPEYLKIKIKVIDEAGKVLQGGSNLAELQRRLSQDSRSGAGQDRPAQLPRHVIEAEGLTDWSLDRLPERLEVGEQLKLLRYPALIDAGQSVAVRLLTDLREATAQTRLGLVRLLRLRTPQQAREMLQQFGAQQRRWGLRLPAFLVGKPAAEAFVFAVYCHCFQLRDTLPRDKTAFEQRLQRQRSELFEAAAQLTTALGKVVDQYVEVQKILGRSAIEDTSLGKDLQSQLDNLLAEDFLLHVPFEWLRETPRYLQAIAYRLDKAPAQLVRDQELQAEIQPHWQRLLESARGQPGTLNSFVEDRPELARIRWMLEELRVSCFAQQLRTRMPASTKRLERLWEEAGKS
jgi:ATP-dependent helicase HrpA